MVNVNAGKTTQKSGRFQNSAVTLNVVQRSAMETGRVTVDDLTRTSAIVAGRRTLSSGPSQVAFSGGQPMNSDRLLVCAAVQSPRSTEIFDIQVTKSVSSHDVV